MRIVVRILIALVLLVVVVAAAGVGYLYLAFPRVSPPPVIQVQKTPEQIARGEYLANHVAGCVGCHAERDWTRSAAPLKPGTLGRGGERFGPESGFPGTVYAPNITPAGIGSWTDGEVMRAMTTGVSKDGTPLFPLMPYPEFGQLAQDDLEAIIAYIRTLPPTAHTTPRTALDFPLNLIVRTIPGPASLKPRPPASDKVAYGKYLVTAGGCQGCHTKMDDMGRPSADVFAGGMEAKYPPNGHRVVTANITPDAGTGIGSWTEQQFIDKFKGFETPSDAVLSGDELRQNTIMPWTFYAGMTRDDLSAMYAYLRTLKPVVNRVTKHPDANPVAR